MYCHPWDLRHDAKTNYLLGKWRDYVGAEDRLLYIIDGGQCPLQPRRGIERDVVPADLQAEIHPHGV